MKLARREGQLVDLLETLARLEPRATAQALSELALRERLPHGVSVITFSYELDARSSRLSEVLQQRRLATARVVCGPAAVEPGNAVGRVLPLEALRRPPFHSGRDGHDGHDAIDAIDGLAGRCALDGMLASRAPRKPRELSPEPVEQKR